MEDINRLFTDKVKVEDNLIILAQSSGFANQQQTNEIFSDKWTEVNNNQSVEKLSEFQFNWYFDLYGFQDRADITRFLKDKHVILDAGCGLGYKAAWFAEMAPESLVIGMDFSDAAFHAANRYKHVKNLYFVRGDIADSHLKKETIDFVSCDQVLQHTENPEATFRHLTEITKTGGRFACYVYAKKALPRELLDSHFSQLSKHLTRDQLWELSKQRTQL